MSLEAKVPPPAVAAATALIIWGISRLAPQVQIPISIRLVASLAIVAAGIALASAGLRLFRQAQTTPSPTNPEEASALVTEGIYRFSRNPMYLGVTLILVAWAVLLSSAWALFGVASFVLYINCFQVVPEERVLARIFGSEYASYKTRVRRWL